MASAFSQTIYDLRKKIDEIEIGFNLVLDDVMTRETI